MKQFVAKQNDKKHLYPTQDFLRITAFAANVFFTYMAATYKILHACIFGNGNGRVKNPPLRSLLFFILLCASPSTHAGEITAYELQNQCIEMQKAASGKPHKTESVIFCRGYLSGFFDSLVIHHKKRGRPFCLPHGTPTSTNYEILSHWVEKYPKLSTTTTASVALYAAFKEAFPCSN